MPIYIYECSTCGENFKVSHSMTEECDECEICNSPDIHRTPSLFFNFSKKNKSTNKTGALTKEAIEESYVELEEQKKKLQSQRTDK